MTQKRTEGRGAELRFWDSVLFLSCSCCVGFWFGVVVGVEEEESELNFGFLEVAGSIYSSNGIGVLIGRL